MSSHHKSLLFELLSNITWGRSGNLDPSLGEDGACSEHEDDVDGSMHGIDYSGFDVSGRRHVICDTRRGEELRRSLTRFPNTKELDQDVIREARVEHLADQEVVRCESRLKHDWHVRGIEQTNWVGSTNTSLARGHERNFNAETLEVDDSCEDNEGREQVHNIGKILSVESFAEGNLLVWPGKEEMEESNNGTLKFWASTSVNGSRREGLPDDRLADVGSNEEGDTASEAIALLQQFIQENNDKTSSNELKNKE